MEFGLAFSFPFKDPEWFKKIALAALVSLIPIIGQLFLVGWGVEIVRRVINNDPVPLPDLDFGQNLGKGFLAWIISLIYSIPAIILSIPIAIVDSTGSSLTGDPQTTSTLFAIVSICCGGIILIYSILLAFTLPASLANFAAKGSFGAAFEFGEIFHLVSTAPVAFLLVVVGEIIAGFIASLGIIICVIGVVLTTAYSYTIIAHLAGQAYKEAKSMV